MMTIVLFEELDYDIGKEFYEWKRYGCLELCGSWDWTKPIKCSIIVANSKFYAFAVIHLEMGTYEYKWKFTCSKCTYIYNNVFYRIVNCWTVEVWINDKSGRPNVSEHNNQLIEISHVVNQTSISNMRNTKGYPYIKHKETTYEKYKEIMYEKFDTVIGPHETKYEKLLWKIIRNEAKFNKIRKMLLDNVLVTRKICHDVGLYVGMFI